MLDHNNDVGRKKRAFVSQYSKAAKTFVLKAKYEKKRNVWRQELLVDIISYCKNPESLPYNTAWDELFYVLPIPQNIAPVPKVGVDDLLNKRMSRMRN